MNPSFDFTDPQHFTAGAIGEPGERTFYLQAGDEHGHATLKIEKQQVAALADFLKGVLEDMPAGPAATAPIELLEPIEPAWVVGQIAVAVDEADARIMLVVEELLPFVDDDEDDDALEAAIEAMDAAEMRVRLEPAQARQFVEQAAELMSGGRPPCRFCGQPLDPTGHVCPRMN